jgi:hypothetical protein
MILKTLRTALALAPALFLASLSRPASAEALARKPYLQTLTPTSAILVWTTDVAAGSVVHYGTSPQDLTKAASAPGTATQHEVKITGLKPSTRYYYNVGSSNGVLAGGDANHYLVTAPTTGTKQKFRAWIVGDSGTGNSAQKTTRDAMLSHVGSYRPDLFLHLGDIAYDTGTTAQFTSNFFNIYASVLENTVVWPTMGNHEGASSDSKTQIGPYYTAYVLPKAGEAGGMPSGTEAYYAFDWANVHFVVLNSQDIPNTAGSAMVKWLSSDLASTAQDWIVAYFHHPPYTRGSHNSDTEQQLIQMRENVLPVLEAAGVDLVLAGHSHIYERSFLLDGAYATPTTAAGHIKDSGDGKPLGGGPYVKKEGNNAHDGAVYVVAGHGGASVSGAANHPVMYFSEVKYGSCLLDVSDNQLSVINVRSDGVVSDNFAIVKGTGLVVGAPDGGEVLTKGTAFDIRWATVGTIPNVALDYSIDNGKSYLPIVASTPNTGKYTWTVPDVNSARALVRVSSAADAAVHDESNAGFTLLASAPENVISLGDTWKYNDANAPPGETWRELSFDDSGWKSGPAQLGYGNGDEATTLTKASPASPSYYFRKVVKLTGPVIKADLQVLHDDGVAVWVNGTQVFSKYMALGTEHAAYASQTSMNNEISSTQVSLAAEPFVIGDNLVSVLIKQASATSSDVSFDLELRLLQGAPPVNGAGGAGGAGSSSSLTGNGGAAQGSGGSLNSGGSNSVRESTGGCQIGGDSGSSYPMIGVGLLALLMRRRRRASASTSPR